MHVNACSGRCQDTSPSRISHGTWHFSSTNAQEKDHRPHQPRSSKILQVSQNHFFFPRQTSHASSAAAGDQPTLPQSYLHWNSCLLLLQQWIHQPRWGEDQTLRSGGNGFTISYLTSFSYIFSFNTPLKPFLSLI